MVDYGLTRDYRIISKTKASLAARSRSGEVIRIFDSRTTNFDELKDFADLLRISRLNAANMLLNTEINGVRRQYSVNRQDNNKFNLQVEDIEDEKTEFWYAEAIREEHIVTSLKRASQRGVKTEYDYKGNVFFYVEKEKFTEMQDFRDWVLEKLNEIGFDPDTVDSQLVSAEFPETIELNKVFHLFTFRKTWRGLLYDVEGERLANERSISISDLTSYRAQFDGWEVVEEQ